MPTVTQIPGALEPLQQGLDQLIKVLALRKEWQLRQQDLQLRREEFDLDKFRVGKAAELTDEQIAASRLEREVNKKKLDDEAEKLEAERTSLGLISDTMLDFTSNGVEFGSPEWQQGIAQLRATIDHPAGQTLVDQFIDQQRGVATDTSDITRDEVTAETNIKNAETMARSATVQEGNLALNRMSTVSTEAVRGGITYGQAGDLLRTPVPPELRDINPMQQIAQMQADLAGQGKRSDLSMRAGVFWTMMKASVGPMEMMLEQAVAERGGLDKLTDPLARFNAKGFLSNLFISAAMKNVPDEDRAIIAYARNFVANWQYFASGAQINEGEYARLMDTFFDRSTDGPLTRAAKKAMRQAAVGAIQQMATGQWEVSPVEGVLSTLEDLKAQSNQPGWTPEMRAEINVELQRTQQLHDDLVSGKRIVLDNAPGFISPSGDLIELSPPEQSEAEAHAVGFMNKFYQNRNLPSSRVP